MSAITAGNDTGIMRVVMSNMECSKLVRNLCVFGNPEVERVLDVSLR